jgi:1-acyl-sn-glycerol-3-phosphate acyltransferase
MDYFLLPLRVLYKIYFLSIFVITLIIVYPFLIYYLAEPKRFPKAFVLMEWHAYLILVITGIHLKVKGIENIPQKGAFIICPNHTSYVDIFCLYSIFRRYFVFIGKQEIENWPLFHIYYTSGMNILVDRHNKNSAIKALKRMSKEIDKGNPLMIFPEGTISKNVPKLAPFKSGAFALAIQKQIPILPVTFVTNWKRLQRSGLWHGKAGPGIAEVIIHKPIQTKGVNKESVGKLQSQAYHIICGPLSIPMQNSYSMQDN